MAELSDFHDLTVHWSSSEEMSDVSNGSVQSVITSPPYWNLKDYGHDEQIGSADDSYEKYLDRVETVFSECYDCLCGNGTMWIVVDSFIEKGDTKLLPRHTAARAQDVGFSLQDVILWYKPTAIAGYNDRTVVNKKEYIVFLSKSRNFDLYPNQDESSGNEDPGNGSKGVFGNVWRHPIKRGSLGKEDILHKAPYPVSLAKRMVNISTKPGEKVLDPFLGSGTTAYAALSTGRECTGHEINKEFEEMISARLSDIDQMTLSTNYGDD